MTRLIPPRSFRQILLHAGDRGSNPSHVGSIAKRSERVSRILGDDHFKRMACFTEGVERLRIFTAQYP